MSTYIVEVDSSYRDLNSYPNQCDFAVSFNQNLTSAPQVLGQPYSFTGQANNYFTKCSIDPDYQNSDLKVIGGNIQAMERLDTSFFLSGIMFGTLVGSTVFEFELYDKDDLLFSYETRFLSNSPYLCRLDKQVNGSYKLIWIIYMEDDSDIFDPSYDNYFLYEPGYSRYSVCHISLKEGLFWITDNDYQRFKLFRRDQDGNTNELYDITPTKDADNQLCNYVFAFDTTGNPYFVDNRPWGYHILRGSFRLQPVNFEGKLGVETNSADDLYVMTNMDPTDVDWLEVRNGWLEDDFFTYDQECYLQTCLCAYRVLPGGTGPTEYLITDTDLTYFALTSSYILIIQSPPDSLRDAVFTAQIVIPELYANDLTAAYQGYMCEIGGKVYYMTVGFDIIGVSPGLFPVFIYEINPLLGTLTLIATTPSRFNSCWSLVGCNNGTNLIYLAVRDNNATVYMYRINVSTNTVTELNSIVLPTSVTVYSMVACEWIDSDNIVVISPDKDAILATGSPFERCRTLWVMKYTISTNTFSIIDNSIQVYPDILTIRFGTWNSEYLTFNIVYALPSETDLYTFARSSTKLKLHYTFDIASDKGTAFNFDKMDLNGNIRQLMVISVGNNKSYLYDISPDTYPPLLLSDNILSGKAWSMTPFITYYGYFYSSFVAGFMLKDRFVTYPTPSLISTHVYKNPSSYTDFIFMQMDIVEPYEYLSRDFLIVANRDGFQVFELNNVINPVLLVSFVYDSSFIDPLYYAQIYPRYNPDGSLSEYIYIAIGSESESRVYYTDYLCSSVSLIQSYVPEQTRFAGLGIVYTANAFTPSHYLILNEKDGHLRKYELSSSESFFIKSADYPAYIPGYEEYLTLTGAYYNLKPYYFSQVNRYTMVAAGNIYDPSDSINSPYGITFMFDVTNYTDLEPTNLTQPIYTVAGNFKTNAVPLLSDVYGQSRIRPFNCVYSGNVTSSAIGGTLGILLPFYGDYDDFIFVGITKSFNAINKRGVQLSQPKTEETSMSGAFTFQSTHWTNTLTNRRYLAMNPNGSSSMEDVINIMDVTTPESPTQQGSTKLKVDGIVKWMTSYSIGTRNILAMIVNSIPTGPNGESLGPSRLWLYDVSNIDSAINSLSERVISETYTNFGATIGAGLVHKIDAFGEPSWICYAGGNLKPGCTNSTFQQVTINPNGNLYVAGGWVNHLQFFNTPNLPSTTLSGLPMNDLLLVNGKQQGFVAEIDTFDGKWTWVVPIAGIGGDLYTPDIRFSVSQNTILGVSQFSSINAYIYQPQQSVTSPTGFTLGKPQRFFFNSSSANSIVYSIDTRGYFKWRAVLFTKGGNSSTRLKSVWVDETIQSDPIVVVSGLNNSSTLRGEDGTSNLIQTLYTQLDPILQNSVVTYTFSLTDGSYLSSVYQTTPPNSTVVNNMVRSYSDLNFKVTASSIYPQQPDTVFTCYNKDSTLADKIPMIFNGTNCIVSSYDVNSLYLDTNTFYYSTVYIYNFTGPTGAVSNSLANSYLFVLGDLQDILINKNFTIRSSEYDFENSILKIVLNQQVLVNRLVRRFSIINNIPESDQYYSSNVSISPLYDIGYYNYNTGSISMTGNSITFTALYNNPPGTFDLTKDYYFMVPNNSSSETSLVPITTITYDKHEKRYTMTVEDINDLRVPSPSGPFYGPYINIGQKNYSAFYSLQWYPGARLFAQSYLVGLYDLIIPNRPVRNAQFPGVRYLTDYPYIYLVIYNADEQDKFDSTVVNSVYDNNVNVPRFALFQLPTTSFVSFGQDSNFISVTSSTTPRIRFIPGYYKLRFKLTDDVGNVLYFDNAPSKESDSIFADGVVPEKLLKVTVRMAFKRG